MERDGEGEWREDMDEISGTEDDDLQGLSRKQRNYCHILCRVMEHTYHVLSLDSSETLFVVGG